MSDDFLKDFEGELRAAAERRRGPRPRVPWPVRVAGPALAAAAVAAVVVLALSGGSSDPREEVPAQPSAPDTRTLETGVAPLLGSDDRSCTIEESTYAPDPPLDFIERSMAIFRRAQSETDLYDTDRLRGVPATRLWKRLARVADGTGGRVFLVPTDGVERRCAQEEHEGPGVCAIAERGDPPPARCFRWEDVREGRALAAVATETVMGLVTDEVESVVIEHEGARVEAAVNENAWRARLPGVTRGTVRVTLRLRSLDGCAPSAAMRAAVPALDARPPAGGVPPAVRGSLRFDFDSRVAARHARIWGGGDGVTYWVVPWLRCEDPGAEHDSVCVYPLFEGQEKGGGGGRACGTLEEVAAGRAWIHFPLRDGRAAAAGLAPAGAAEAVVRVNGEDVTQVLPVRDGVWAGTLDYDLRGEVGGLEVSYRGDHGTPPTIGVLNGTPVTGAAGRVMEALEGVNYRRGVTGNWFEHNLKRTVVYFAPGQDRLGHRVASYLAEHFGIPAPAVRPLPGEANELAGADDAVVAVGADLAR